MATIQNKFTGDISQLEREMERLRKQLAKVEDSQTKVVRSSKEAAKEADQLWSSMRESATDGLRRLGESVVAYGSLKEAIRLVNDEIERKKRLEKEARGEQITEAQSRAGVLLALGRASDQDKARFTGALDALKLETGFSDSIAWNSAARSILDRTGQNQNATLEIMGAMSGVYRHRPDEMAGTGEAAAELDRLNVGLTRKGIVSFIEETMGEARVAGPGAATAVSKSIEMYLDNAKPDADRNQIARQVAGLFVAVSNKLGDTDGAKTFQTLTAIDRVLDKSHPGQLPMDAIRSVVAQGDDGAEDLLRGMTPHMRGLNENLIRELRSTFGQNHAGIDEIFSIAAGQGGTGMFKTPAERDHMAGLVKDMVAASGGDVDQMRRIGAVAKRPNDLELLFESISDGKTRRVVESLVQGGGVMGDAQTAFDSIRGDTSYLDHLKSQLATLGQAERASAENASVAAIENDFNQNFATYTARVDEIRLAAQKKKAWWHHPFDGLAMTVPWMLGSDEEYATASLNSMREWRATETDPAIRDNIGRLMVKMEQLIDEIRSDKKAPPQPRLQNHEERN